MNETVVARLNCLATTVWINAYFRPPPEKPLLLPPEKPLLLPLENDLEPELLLLLLNELELDLPEE